MGRVIEKNAKQAPTKTAALPQEKFVRTRAEMGAALIERGGEIDLVLTAILANEHVLLVGPPGTAKTMIGDIIASWIEDGVQLPIHCCKDMTRNTVFGALDVNAALKGETKRNLTGGAADCHLLTLDEVFKSGPAALDPFLLLLSNRAYKEGLIHRKDCPLLTAIGLSNEWAPEGCEAALAAFSDRFLFRKSVKYIRTAKGRARLLWDPDLSPKLSTQISIGEIKAATAQVARVLWTSDAQHAMQTLLTELPKEGINPGDRRVRKSKIAAQAFAYLCGASQVEPEHLEILAHVLWDDPSEQPATCAKIVMRTANPAGMMIASKLGLIEDVIAKSHPNEAVVKLQGIQNDLKQLVGKAPHQKLADALAYVQEQIETTYNKVLGKL